MSDRSTGRMAWRLLPIVLLVLPAMAWLLSQSFRWNLERACIVRDTPYLDICDETPTSAAGQAERLRARIVGNPGDSPAYVALASVANRVKNIADLNLDPASTLRAATVVAPHDPDLLRLQIEGFARRREWRQALPLLVELAEFHTDVEAARVLSNWIHQDSRVARLLIPYVERGSQWVVMALHGFRIDGLSIANALPLVSDALSKGVLSSQDIQPVMRSLKAEGHWIDAYSLWQQQNASPLGPLYNPDFESPIQADGFDWELAASPRGGAIAQRIAMGDRGYVLSVAYAGRPMSGPPARQQLFLYDGVYQLELQYALEKFRSEKGLAWVMRCESGGAELGRSAPLSDTKGVWKVASFEFRVPRACLTVVNLQLETAAAFEMTAGVSGRAYFDSFVLKRLEANVPP